MPVRDPCTERVPPVGQTKISFKVPPASERDYIALLKDEAFATLAGLRAEHAFGPSHGGAGHHGGHGGAAAAAAAAAAASSSGTSMKRHMKVSAELASMTSLAVHWGSSVLARTDEASMDLMRALIVGPPDTACESGGWRARAQARARRVRARARRAAYGVRARARAPQ